jgi:hypothetical protein
MPAPCTPHLFDLTTTSPDLLARSTSHAPCAPPPRRYHPFVQARGRVDQLRRLGHAVDKVEFILMGGTFMSLPASYRDFFVRNLHDALSGHSSASVDEAVRSTACLPLGRPLQKLPLASALRSCATHPQLPKQPGMRSCSTVSTVCLVPLFSIARGLSRLQAAHTVSLVCATLRIHGWPPLAMHCGVLYGPQCAVAAGGLQRAQPDKVHWPDD